MRHLIAAALAGGALLCALPAAATAANPDDTTVITLGFDDGLTSQFQHRDLLAKYGFHATFYINSGMIGGDRRISWSDVQQLAAEGHEIGGHTRHHANLETTDATLREDEVCGDRTEIGTHVATPISFAYPNGADGHVQGQPPTDLEKSIHALVEGCGYMSARTTRGINGTDPASCDVCAERIPPANKFATRAAQVFEDPSAETMIDSIDAAHQTGGGWLQLVMHDVCDAPCDGLTPSEEQYAIPTTTLDTVLKWIKDNQVTKHLVVATAGQVITGNIPPVATDPDPGPGDPGPGPGDPGPGSGNPAPGPSSGGGGGGGGAPATTTPKVTTAPSLQETPPPAPSAPPAAARLRGVDGSVPIRGLVTLTAEPGDGPVDRVEFLVDGQVVGAAAAAPYALRWDSRTARSTTVRLATRVVSGGQSTLSPEQVVRVDNLRPLVVLRSIRRRAGGRFVVTARATDASGIASVRFTLDGRSVATDRTSPFTARFRARRGAHRLVAIATDRAGNVRRSSTTIRIR